MDEQQMNQSASWSSEADGLAYEGNETGSDGFDENVSVSTDDYTEDFQSEPVSSAEGNLTLNPDGELEFSDGFFGDLGKDEPPAPQRYTQEELKSTPFENWDESRLEGDIRDYIPIVRDQLMRRQMEQQLSQRAATPPMSNAPQPYTPAELAKDAQNLAVQRLGLQDPDDFDEYEGEHQAAYKLAMDELSQRRNAEVANYQRVTKDYQELQNFNAALVRQPDYSEFDRWFTGKLNEAGVTAQQVNAGLQEYARRSGGDYASLRGVISNWYQEFRNERSGRQAPRRSNRPPTLESPRGTNYEGRRSVNMRNFGNLDPDAQAQALMRMGVV